MRRIASAFLILLFWLGPLAAILPGDDESRLPPCCRRYGAHHCAISARMMAEMEQAASSSTPIFTAPSHCPLFPGCSTGFAVPIHALAAAAASLPILLVQPYSPATNRAEARVSQIRTRTGRGPPETTLG